MHLPKLLREGAAHFWPGQWLYRRQLFRALLKSVVRSHLIRHDQKVQRLALAPPVRSYSTIASARTYANRGNVDSRVEHSERIPPFRCFPFLTLGRSA